MVEDAVLGRLTEREAGDADGRDRHNGKNCIVVSHSYSCGRTQKIYTPIQRVWYERREVVSDGPGKGRVNVRLPACPRPWSSRRRSGEGSCWRRYHPLQSEGWFRSTGCGRARKPQRALTLGGDVGQRQGDLVDKVHIFCSPSDSRPWHEGVGEMKASRRIREDGAMLGEAKGRRRGRARETPQPTIGKSPARSLCCVSLAPSLDKPVASAARLHFVMCSSSTRRGAGRSVWTPQAEAGSGDRKGSPHSEP